MATVRFSFLTAGPAFEVQVPDDFDATPETSAPLSIKDGKGWRSYVFVPNERDEGVSEPRLVRELTDRDGRTVEMYEDSRPPTIWLLRWLLPGGVIYTHLRQEEGPDWADTIVENLGIVENASLPVLLPEPPLARAVSTRPGFQEDALFGSQTGPESLTLRRPGYLDQGKVVREPDTPRVVLRGGACCEIECLVVANELERAQEVLSNATNSLTEAAATPSLSSP
jgi:hypothetical protein